MQQTTHAYIDEFDLDVLGNYTQIKGDSVAYCGCSYDLNDCAYHIRKAVEQERERLMGFPPSLRIYDNPRYLDRYTVIFTKRPEARKNFEALALPAARKVSTYPGFHLGKRIWLSDLPAGLVIAIEAALETVDY